MCFFLSFFATVIISTASVWNKDTDTFQGNDRNKFHWFYVIHYSNIVLYTKSTKYNIHLFNSKNEIFTCFLVRLSFFSLSTTILCSWLHFQSYLPVPLKICNLLEQYIFYYSLLAKKNNAEEISGVRCTMNIMRMHKLSIGNEITNSTNAIDSSICYLTERILLNKC